MKVTFYRDPAPEGGAGALPLTLDELFDQDRPDVVDTPPVVVVPPAIVPGTGELKPDDLAIAAAAAQKIEDDAAAAELETARLAEEAAAAAEADKDKTPEGDDEPPAGDAEQFFAAVEAITGETVEVEYPADVDPISPEGIALRDKAVREDEVNKWVEHLKAQDPRGYAYLLHRQAGGDDASFYETKTVALPDQATFDASVELQTSVYKQSLLSKGVDDDIADAMIAKAIKENTLKTKADGAYTSIKEAQAQQLADLEEQDAEDKAAFEEQCTKVTSTLNKTIDNGELKFIVPEVKKAGFKDFINNSLRHENGKFYMVHEVGDDPKNSLEAMYFKYIKGDLTSLVEKRAGTKTVQSLKLRVKAAAGAAPKAGDKPKPETGYVPLGSI